MIYGGPTEVLFHAKSRRNAGATYFVAGRDPAGMKGSELAQVQQQQQQQQHTLWRHALAPYYQHTILPSDAITPLSPPTFCCRQAHPDDDLYDGNHGRYVLTMSPGQDPMDILPFAPVYYDKRDHVMKVHIHTHAPS